MDLQPRSLFLLAFCNCFLVWGIFFAHHAVMTIQMFILASPCSQNISNATVCCPDCLGLSSVQYGLSMGLPAWVAIIVIFSGGAVLDLLGLPTAALTFSFLALFGAILRSLAPYLVTNTVLVFAALTAGNSLIEPAKYGALTITQFVAIRYFLPKWQALIISLTYSSATLGGILGGFITPLLATLYGTKAAFLAMVCATLVTLTAAMVLAAVFRFSVDLSNFEAKRKQSKSQEANQTSLGFIWRSVKGFQMEYWFILAAFSLTSGAVFTYVNNIPLIQGTLFRLSSIMAARFVAYGWMFQILISPILGVLLSHFPWLITAAFFSSATAAASLLSVLIPGGSPLASSLLTGVPYALLIMALSPIMEDFVPADAVGLASSIIHCMESATFGLLTAALGALLNDERKVQASRRTLAVLLGVMVLQTWFLFILALRLKSDFKSYTEEETETLNPNGCSPKLRKPSKRKR